jgi:hypothetical protein
MIEWTGSYTVACFRDSDILYGRGCTGVEEDVVRALPQNISGTQIPPGVKF